MRTYEKWVKKSHRLPGASQNPWIAIDFQALGRLDTILVDSWNKIKDSEIDSDHMIIMQNDVFMLSRLWVLSAYEIVRVLKELDSERFDSLYKLYKKVRIPLAKYEKANDKKKRLCIAQLGWTADHKLIGWHVGPNEFISREQLAEDLFNAISG